MPRKAKKKSLLRRLIYFTLIVTIVAVGAGGVVLSGYLLKLDQEIRTKFAGVRWALPAQVYAAPTDLYPGQRITRDGLKHELQRLGYRQLSRLDGPGTFAVSGDRIQLHSRAFHFWDGAQAEQQLAAHFNRSGISRLQNLASDQPLHILRLDPMLIGSIYPQKQGEDRVLVRLNELPPLLRDGLIAVEDRRFYEHFGIDVRGVARAAVANVRAGRVVQGASTITQQLVKNFFLTSRRDWSRKFKEMLMSLLLESHYEKDEILEAYFNEIYLGQDGNRAVHGFGLASQFYFNKPLRELRSHEIALLVGVVKGASAYNPRRRPQVATKRRNLILGVFRDSGLIDDAEYDAAIQRPLGLAGRVGGGVERYPAFVDLVKRQLRGQYQEEDLTEEGLRIFTTLDPRAQEVLEFNVHSGLAQLEKRREKQAGQLQAAGVVTSVDGGEVLALVGGRQVRYAGFNRALDSRRSIGSLVKPFVYLTALAKPERFSLHSLIDDEPIQIRLPNGNTWAPRNYDHKLHGSQPLYMALAHSYNLPAVRTGLEVGAKQVLKTLRAAGYSGEAEPLPSLFLGSVEISPLEVAQMFATLAASGYRSPLSAIREVTTKENMPMNRYPIRVRQTLEEAPSYLMHWAMTKVLRNGTARSAYRYLPGTAVMAGKTGTTNDLRDAWFAGFGADRVGVIWVGRDDYKPMGFTGSSGALPIWSRTMRDLGARSLDMIPPADVEQVLTDQFTSLRADQGCTSTITIPYIRGHAPVNYAPCASASEPTPMNWLREIFE